MHNPSPNAIPKTGESVFPLWVDPSGAQAPACCQDWRILPPDAPERRHGETRWLYHRRDIFTIVWIVIDLLALSLPVIFDAPLWSAPLIILVNGILAFQGELMSHNHTHHPTSPDARVNRLFDFGITLVSGHPVTNFKVAHDFNHHEHNGRAGDWFRPQQASPGPLRIVRFVVNTLKEIGENFPDLPRRESRRMLHEKVAVFGFLLAMLAIDPLRGILFVAIPWGIGWAFLIGVNLPEHDGCDPEDEYAHSRDFTGRFLNWIYMNAGYHTVHHLQPGLHWSLQHAWDARAVEPRQPERLREPSLVAFVWREYLRGEPALIREWLRSRRVPSETTPES